MKYLLDTMVVSEPARPGPNRHVLKWIDSQVVLELAISVLTLGEVSRGVARMPDSKRKTALDAWLAKELPAQFENRVLDVDVTVALAWGELTARGDRIGRPLPVIDGLLLATALANDLTLVTRNEDDFSDRGVPILNPYR